MGEALGSRLMRQPALVAAMHGWTGRVNLGRVVYGYRWRVVLPVSGCRVNKSLSK